MTPDRFAPPTAERRLPAPAIVFVVTLLLAVAAAVYVARTSAASEALRFESVARQAAASLSERLETATTLLRATSGLFAADNLVGRGEFNAFVERLNLRVRYPGIQGIGYSQRVRRAAIDSLRRAMARQGAPNFDVWPRMPLAAEQHAIVYLEPLDRRNAAALGYDMFSDPVRRDAMRRAWESGTAAATGRVTLVQEIDKHKQAGFLIYVPVYRSRGIPASLAQRRDELLGFVYSPFRAGDLLAAAFYGPPAEMLNVWVYDGAKPDPAQLLFASDTTRLYPTAETRRLELPLDVAGRRWLLVFAPRAGSALKTEQQLAPLIFGLGVLVSLALFGVTRAEARARYRAELAAREVRRSEEAARASEQRFRFLAEFIPTLVWAARPDGTVDYVNQRCTEYLGVQTPDLLAGGWWEFVHPDDVSGPRERWRLAVRTGQPYEAEYRLRRSDGSYRWHLDRGAPLRNEAGEITRWFGTCTDVDDPRRAQQALQQAQKLESIGVLAGGIAHDFNNLLTGITGNVSLAASTLPPDDAARPMLDDALRASERAASLTAQLLAYAGKGRFFLQSVDLRSLVDELVPLIRATISRKVAVRLDLAPDCPTVRGDASQLQQLLMNLIINGAEAIGDAVGTVTVRVRGEVLGERPAEFAVENLAAGLYARIEVEDTGCGMDQATLAQIFDPFFTTKFTGRGLGLAAALGIVRGHRGAIGIRTTPGHGSTFSVVLPGEPSQPEAADSAPATAAPAAASPSPAASPPPAAPAAAPSAPQLPVAPNGNDVVLLADDELAVRRVGMAALERLGYEVLVAEDGGQALALALAPGRQLRLAMLDLTMPELGGAEVARRLREAWPTLPIVVMSGYGEQEALLRLAGITVDGFLPKPFTDKQLERAVEQALGG
ncbi:MAG TPA: CHASE domain-containing protein [Gemmatimonadales bacterium]|nr:CHASE domain-containing protein [Gemmatimonadales bacterium]